MNLTKAGSLCHMAQIAMRNGKSGLTLFPGTVIRVIESGCWRQFVVEQTGEQVTFDTFSDFVSADLPEGLGADKTTLLNLCSLRSSDEHRKAFALIEAAYDPAGDEKGKGGGGNNPHGCKGKPSGITVNNVNADSPARPVGNSREATMRRLRKDHPQLHQQVVAGDLSANAAAVKAGFRKKLTALEAAIKAYEKLDPREQLQFATYLAEGKQT